MAQETADQVKAESIIRVTGIHHMGIPCNDLDRAAAFYCEVFGMEVVGQLRGKSSRTHFTGSNIPADAHHENPDGERVFAEYAENYKARHPEQEPLTNFMRLRAGHDDVVLFQRSEPVTDETLMVNGIFHQSLHISPEDMSRLAELKERGDPRIRFISGPTLRWPHGRAMYLWDSEGNHIELESEEDLTPYVQR